MNIARPSAPAIDNMSAGASLLISAQLAAFADGLTLAHIPERVVEKAKLHILDCLGIALASTTYDFAHRTINAVRGMGGDGEYPVIGMPVSLPLRDQVLANGTLIHGLDYDDTHTAGVVHASASAIAAALGQALRSDSSGANLIVAYLIGVETASRIGMAANGGFHARGHHPTGLVGTFGATLTACKLAGLTQSKMMHAQGVALSMGAGSMEFLADGAWTKRMHPGWAAANGVTAAGLADQGFEGPSEAYEGRYGLFNLHLGTGHDADLSVCTQNLGQDWEMEMVGFKPYPACHLAHSFADAARTMRDEGIRADQIEKITALINATSAQVVCEPLSQKHRPTSAYEAQFSVPYIVAQSFLRGQFTLDELDQSALSEEPALQLAEKVDWAEDPDSRFPKYFSGELVVQTTDGQTRRYREDYNRGSDANPVSTSDFTDKFWANAGRAVNRARAERVYDAVMNLEKAESAWPLANALSTA